MFPLIRLAKCSSEDFHLVYLWITAIIRKLNPELAKKAGVGLRFIRDLEQGKPTLRMEKVNQVLRLFGNELGAKEIKSEHHV